MKRPGSCTEKQGARREPSLEDAGVRGLPSQRAHGKGPRIFPGHASHLARVTAAAQGRAVLSAAAFSRASLLLLSLARLSLA